MTRPHPQRIFPPSAPGSLLKRFGEKPAPRKDDGDKDLDYLKNIRACPCLHCGMDPAYEAAHVRYASAAHGKAPGLSKRPQDRWSVPLCPEAHRLARDCQHAGNEQLFWDRLGINPLILCAELYAKRADLVAMRAVVMVAIARRSKQDSG